MDFLLPEYKEPDFSAGVLVSSSDAATLPVEKDGVAPEGYHATTIYPEYIKCNGKWHLLERSRMDCVVVVRSDQEMEVVEFRRLTIGDRVVVGRSEDGSEGIYVHTDGFRSRGKSDDPFAFRTGRSRETSYSRD